MRADHVARVRHLAGILAAELGMGKDIAQMQKASILADTGKIEIAEGILNKPGGLTEQEWAEMKRHPEFGYNFLTTIRPLGDVGAIVLAHHERYDGQGYPRGLTGDDIPLGERIFALVDAYTAMASDRPHRKKIPHEIALNEILRNSLTQFDPEVVRALCCEERGLIAGPHTPKHQNFFQPRSPGFRAGVLRPPYQRGRRGKRLDKGSSLTPVFQTSKRSSSASPRRVRQTPTS